MSLLLAKSVRDLILEFEKFPGIGPKSASRIVYYLLNAPEERSTKLSELLLKAKHDIRNCSICYNMTDKNICDICSDESRLESTICLVEDSLDIIAVENSAVFKGKYHVLGGLISPISGIGPENLRITQLKNRVVDFLKGNNTFPLELIIALNPTMEGDATSMYISEILKDIKNITISRIARGLPTGADIEYADYMTLKKSIENRIKY